MGLSIALMEGFAQSVGGIAAAQRQADAQAQAQAQVQAEAQAQQAQLKDQAEEQRFQRWVTGEKLGLERQKLQADIDSRQGKQVPFGPPESDIGSRQRKQGHQVDPEIAIVEALKKRFPKEEMNGLNVRIDPMTGEPAKPEVIEAFIARMRGPPPPAAVAPTPVAPGAPTFDPNEVAARIVQAVTPEEKEAALAGLTEEQGAQVLPIAQKLKQQKRGAIEAQTNFEPGLSASQVSQILHIEQQRREGRISKDAADRAFQRIAKKASPAEKLNTRFDPALLRGRGQIEQGVRMDDYRARPQR